MQSITWLDVDLLQENHPHERVLVFSPDYQENHPLRYRIVDVQFVRKMADVRQFARLTPPGVSLPS